MASRYAGASLSRNLPWARPNWVSKHYAREGLTREGLTQHDFTRFDYNDAEALNVSTDRAGAARFSVVDLILKEVAPCAHPR
jgi:hypothetical protein